MLHHRRYRIGHSYWVPHVDGWYCGIDASWPVMGPQHEDLALIGFPDLHYHVDERFVAPALHHQLRSAEPQSPESMQQFGRISVYRRAPLMRHSSEGARGGSIRDFGGKSFTARPAPRSRLLPARCWRPISPAPGAHLAQWMPSLESAHASAQLIRGHCPHRAADLSTLPVDRHGCVECPLHGLVWHVATGRMVPRAQWQSWRDAEGMAHV